MMSVLEYKGYSARLELEAQDGCFVGHIAGINDIVGFHGESPGDLTSAFQEAVDDYVATFGKTRKPPEARQ